MILEKTTYYDCEYEKVTLSKKDAREKAKEDVSLFLKKLEEKGVQIADKNVMIEFTDKECQVHGEITAIERVGRYEPAEVKKISTEEGLAEDESDGT